MEFKKKKKEQRQKPKNINERKENTVRCEGCCPEEEYNRDVCKQTDEAGELARTSSSWSIMRQLIHLQEFPVSKPEPAKEDKNPVIHHSAFSPPENQLPDWSHC